MRAKKSGEKEGKISIHCHEHYHNATALSFIPGNLIANILARCHHQHRHSASTLSSVINLNYSKLLFENENCGQFVMLVCGIFSLRQHFSLRK
jgi:hypothetical protein